MVVLLFCTSCSTTDNNELLEEETSLDSTPVKNETISNVSIDTFDIYTMHQDIDTVVLGDINGDNMYDTAIIVSPVHAYPDPNNYSDGGCEDDSCVTRVYFSFNTAILVHKTALGFQTIFLTDDLNSDGVKEIGFVPNWFQSCQQGLFIYSLTNGEWNQLEKGNVYACNEEDFSQRIKKVSTNKFEFKSLIWSETKSELIDSILIKEIN